MTTKTNFKIEHKAITKNPTALVFRDLSSRERDDNPCDAIQKNRMTCKRPAVAVIEECPIECFELVQGRVVCARHLELFKAATAKGNFEIKEKDQNDIITVTKPNTKPNTNTNTNAK